MLATAHLFAPTLPPTKPIAIQPVMNTRNTMFRLLETFAVKDIDAGQVAQERQHATDVYGIDMGQGFQHEAEDDAEDEDQQLDFTRLDGAHSRQLCSMNVEKCAPETSVSRPFTI